MDRFESANAPLDSRMSSGDAGTLGQLNAAKLRVFVSGCFDLLHAGHLAFLESAAAHGELEVAVASDATVLQLKGRQPIFTELERLRLIQALRFVKRAFISSGLGLLDFEPELRAELPDLFIVNEDGDHADKRKLCHELGIDYRVFSRTPHSGFPARSSSALRGRSAIPHRIELAGAWFDQPFVSQIASGPVIVASIWPDFDVRPRTGLATSTHRTAMRLWHAGFPSLPAEEVGEILFACENPPGTETVAGSQDALGLALPGVNRLDYSSKYWPESIQSITDEATLAWLESVVHIVPLDPRPKDFDVLQGMNLEPSVILKLRAASEQTWRAIQLRDANLLGKSLTAGLEAHRQLFPAMCPGHIQCEVDQVAMHTLGAKFTGAGGGGYLVAVSDVSDPKWHRFKIRRS